MSPRQIRGIAAASDIELAACSARGDRVAFGMLVERAIPPVHAFLRRLGAQPALADDLTQDAMIAALRGISGYRGEAPFPGWVMKIAARLYFKRHRKDARLELMADPIDLQAPQMAMEGSDRLDLDRALARLTTAERLCVSLCHGAGMTHDEIASLLQIPLGTVKSHVTRGLVKLRRLMTESLVTV